ncbi:MAG TPA: hypothetical protein VEC12_04990 [Bacteroidia bacterium]|nr:hypothetical protein [Bacteroidia bacterium]
MNKKLIVYALAMVLFITEGKAQFHPKRNNYSEEEIKELFEEKISDNEFDDEIFESKEVPQKYKNESLVLMGRKIRYEGNVNPWTNIGYLHYWTRLRFKLQDKQALEEFAQYHFNDADAIEITIEKPGGEKEIVDLSEAIEVKEELSDLFFHDIEVERSYKKLAIPNLEIGDIVDIKTFDAMRFNRNFFHWSDALLFIPLYPYMIPKMGYCLLFNTGYSGAFNNQRVLHNNYTVLNTKIEFDLGRTFYLNWRSLNGASDLEERESKGRKRRLWVFTDGARDKMKNETWAEPMYNLPAIKYQICIVNKRERKHTKYIIDKRNKLKTAITTKDIKKIARRFVKSSNQYTGDIYFNFYKKEGRKIKSDKDFVESFFNYYRTNKLYTIAAESDDEPYTAAVSNRFFISYMLKIVRKRMIPYSLIMGVPRSEGGTESLMSADEIIWGIKLDIEGDEIIYTDCDMYAQPGEINPDFEGMKLYEIKPGWIRSAYKVTDYDISVPHSSQNKFYYSIKAEFQPDYDTVKVSRKTHLTGMARYRYRWISFPYNKYYDKVKEQYNSDSYFIIPTIYEEDLLEDEDFIKNEEKRLTASIVESYQYYARERAEEQLKNSFELVSYDNLKIKQHGLGVDSPDIIFEEQYVLRDLMDDIGGNMYVLKVGEFIEGQVEIKDEEERERFGDISYGYPRLFAYDIEIVIPGGMQVSGLDQLNRNVDNETGNFISTARIDGNVLRIHIEESFKGNFHEKAKWGQVLKFLDEAADFNTAKIILKR